MLSKIDLPMDVVHRAYVGEVEDGLVFISVSAERLPNDHLQ